MDSNLVFDDFYTKYELTDKNGWTQLLTTMYFVFTTLCTVGYGDYIPSTNLEKIFGIFLMILGIGILSYIISNFNTVLSNYEQLVKFEQ